MPENMYPDAVDPTAVGTYPSVVGAGGGFVWDEVLEYRVWCHPERGAPDQEEGTDYFYPFATYAEALAFARETPRAEDPLALVLQREHIAESAPGVYEHITHERLTEWPVEFLSRPKRTDRTISDFLSPSAPPNRFAVIRGLAK